MEGVGKECAYHKNNHISLQDCNEFAFLAHMYFMYNISSLWIKPQTVNFTVSSVSQHKIP